MKLRHQLLGVLLALALACLPVPANAAAASAGEYFDYIDLADGNKADYCGALYSDSMLLADAEALSTDLVKVSAMLATAAYQRDEVVNLLANGMDYRILDDGSSYTIDRTLTDNDIVAYTIARKDIGGYRAYCVVVRGTGKNAEWFSDFNLGINNGGRHQGFHLAADQVWRELEPLLANDGADAAHTIVWLTGHSRGAAVSNILGAWLNQSAYVRQAHMFCYTFACPAVSKDTVSYANIHNFNNQDDVVTAVPLQEWGYGRNGVDHLCAPRDSANALRRYKMAVGHAYHGASPDGLLKTLRNFIPNEKAYYGRTQQLAVFATANSMAGEDAVPMAVLLPTLLEALKWDFCIGLLKRVDRNTDLHYMFKTMVETKANYEELVDNIVQVITHYDPEKGTFIEQIGQELIDTLLAETGIVVDNITTLGRARQALEADIKSMNEVTQAISGIVEALYQTDGELKSALADAHDCPIYDIWTNSAYFGYRGWVGSGATSVTLTGITSVGEQCFYECAKLAKVSGHGVLQAVGHEAFAYSGLKGTLKLPEGFEWVGDDAFYSCAGLETLALPAGLKRLGNGAFFLCEGLRNVTLPIEFSISGVFYGCTSVEQILYLAGSSGIMPDRIAGGSPRAGETDYQDTLEMVSISAKALRTAIFEEGCTHIGSMAFLSVDDGCLEVLILPESLESIGELAFSGQKKLALPLILPEGFTTLGESAFYETGVTALTLPESVKEIPDRCFFNCTGLKEIHLPTSLKRIGSQALTGTAIERIDLPLGLETIGEGAFDSCEKLSEVSAAAELDAASADQYLGGGAVRSLRLVKGGNGVMPDRALENDTLVRPGVGALESVELEKGITHVGDFAFATTTQGRLADVKLPSTLKSIGEGAFEGNSALKRIDLPDRLKRIGASAFARTGLEALTLPAALTTVGENCFDDDVALRYVRFLGNAPAFGTGKKDSVAFTTNVTAEAVYPLAAKGWTDAARKAAGGRLFWHPDKMDTLTLPAELSEIGAEAFAGTDAGCVVIPEGATAIGQRAFADPGQPCVVFHIPSSVKRFGKACLPTGSVVYTPEGSPAWKWFTDLGGGYLCVPEAP